MSYWRAFLSWWTPIRLGITLTTAVLVCFIAMALQHNCILIDATVLECRRNWAWFWASKPNEIGDTLSGFAGALAFIWIVVTVWLQSAELAEQREVLTAQKEEFKAMVAAQNAQVSALLAQAAVLEDEKRRRDETATISFLEENLTSLRLELNLRWLQSLGWRFLKEGSQTSGQGSVIARDVRLLSHYKGPSKVDSIEELLPFLSYALEDTYIDLNGALMAQYKLDRYPSRGDFLSISSRIERMLPSVDGLSSGPSERFHRLQLREIRDALQALIDENRIWGQTE